jgi:peptidase M28-like protein
MKNMFKIFQYFFSTLIILFLFSCSKSENVKNSLYSSVSYLASDELEGRRTCSLGDSLSTNYIINEFKNSGLKSYNKNHKYIQNFPFLADIKVKDNILTTIINNKETKLNHKNDFVIFQKSGNGKSNGQVVFIGYGINSSENNYNDFTKVDLKNKIAICYLYPSPKDCTEYLREIDTLSYFERAQLVNDLGGLGIIYVIPSVDKNKDKLKNIDGEKVFNQRKNKMKIPMLRISYIKYVEIMENAGIEVSSIDNKLHANKSSMSFTIPNLTMSFNINTKYIYKNAHNIFGYVEGEDTSNTILIGAHYDHVGFSRYKSNSDSIRNGADDNASGTALILELAKYYSKNIPNWNLCFVAFGAEEFLMIGSNHFVNNSPIPLNKIKFMLNFDMVGRMRNDSLHIYGISKLKNPNYIFDNFNFKNLFIVKHDDILGSDGAIFYHKNIPTLSIFTGFHQDVHKVTDETDKINFDGMVTVYQVAIELINLLSTRKINLNKQS